MLFRSDTVVYRALVASLATADTVVSADTLASVALVVSLATADTAVSLDTAATQVIAVSVDTVAILVSAVLVVYLVTVVLVVPVVYRQATTFTRRTLQLLAVTPAQIICSGTTPHRLAPHRSTLTS